jgi:hypothetical protein
VSCSVHDFWRRFAAGLLAVVLATTALWAGGPKYVAGTTYFNPAVVGQPVHWAGGQVKYYVDQGPLNSTITNQQATAMVWLDSIRPDATIAHAIILLNGLCATNSSLNDMMSFELERAFGRVLGLDFAQVNPGALTNGEANGTLGWPVMQPLSGTCGSGGGDCIPNPNVLRYDDIAALNRIYPITSSNLASFPGKEITAANTVSIQGTIAFRSGMGMQGVNVVARPLDANGLPLYQYAVTFVSGAYFNGKHGNPVTGWTDASGNLLSTWGSNDATLQGYFDLSDMPLPPGVTTANYQVTFEPVSPLYMLANSVGPYVDGTPAPSGTMQVLSVPGMSAGMSQTLTVHVADSAAGGAENAIGTETAPRMLPGSGLWTGRLSQVGQTDWFIFPVRAGRTFTIITQALDEKGMPTETKALPSLGVWDGFSAPGTAAAVAAPGLNGWATGETWLRVTASADDMVRMGVADLRGDGRPDYAYNGWVLYADSVQPARLPATGGPIVIRGMGFRPSDTVLVDRQAAIVTSISPNEITALAPAAATGVTGSVDVEVDDMPIFYAAAVISGGVSYDSGTGDSLRLVTAPSNTVSLGVPIPFTVTALGSNLAPAGGVTVSYSVSSGAATLGCGLATCTVTATGDGLATMTVTATSTNAAVVTASLTNGASLQAHFSGGTAPTIAALTPSLSVAAGATVSWTTQVLVLSNGSPVNGQSVTWQGGNGIAVQDASAVLSNANGIANKTLTVGPLAEGQQATATACVNGTTQCATFTVTGARPEYATLEAVSGTAQSIAVSGTANQIVLRLRDMNGNTMAGGTVTLYQSVYSWAPPCPAHGRCTATELLATRASTAVSALDGSVVFAPASVPGVATNVTGLAATGNSSTISITIEQHP